MKKGVQKNPPEQFNHQLREDLIYATAKLIRDTYIMEQRFRATKPFCPGPYWDGGRDRCGAMRTSIWLKIAMLVLPHGIHPALFVSRQSPRPCGLPRPNQLLDAKACLQRYNDFAEMDYKNLQFRCESEQRAIRQEVQMLAEIDRMNGGRICNKSKRQSEVLLAKNLDVSPLFRYCLARSEDLAEVADIFHDRAMFQYLHQLDDYTKIWGSCLPDDFKQEAKGYLDSIAASGAAS